MEELTQIEQRWRANGEPYCTHERISPETAAGMRTGDLGCMTCGNSWPKKSTPSPRGRTD